jgi:hypothetical protein
MMRWSVSAHWLLSFDSGSSTILDGTIEDEAEKLYVSAAASLSRHPSAANYLTVELAALKELSQELAELFGLSLPA